MKKVIAIVFLVAVVSQSISKLWVLGSFYLNRNYISANLCVNRFESIPVCKGTCYLNNELKKNEQKEQNLPDLKQKEIQLFFQKSFFNEFSYSENENAVKRFSPTESLYKNDFSLLIFHPPQQA